MILAVLIFFSVVANAQAKEQLKTTQETKEQKNQSMNELNPITHYVNVCQQTDGKSSNFIMCDHKDKGCSVDRTTKNLANAK